MAWVGFPVKKSIKVTSGKGLSAIDEIGHQPTGQEANLFDESRGDVQPHQEHQRQGPTRRRARRVAAHIMDYKQTIIPGSVYQSWLQEASDIVSGRGKKRKRANFMSTMKISDLIKLSPIIFVSGLMGNGRRYIYYPTPLLELGMRRTESPGDSPSGISRPQPHEPSSSSSPLDRVYYQDFAGFPSEDFDNGAGSQSLSIEKTRAVRDEVQTEAVEDVLRTNLVNTGMRPPEASVMVTPGNSGDELRSIPSSGSGHGFSSHTSEIISGWKRAHSSSRRSGSSLETVAEENPWQEPVPHFKLARLSENGLRLTPEHELLVETGPTQTQIPAVNHPIDKITDSIRLHLKSHFDTPGAPQVESLDQLASGMNRKSAAQLFYQTSVLATHDFLRVQQKVPYGDILISRGAKM